ncbi:MAG: glycosyltransferase family protein [Burkholderiales bacterium]
MNRVSPNKLLRILIVPNHPNAYDQRMVKGLANGFHVLGHHAHALLAPLTPIALVRMCENLSINVVIQVNRTRDLNTPLPSHVRHIAWFQDVFPETLDGFAEGFHDSDILYALGDAGVLGLHTALPCYVGSLVTGVDQAVINSRNRPIHSDQVDFSLCGFIPPPRGTTPQIGRIVAARRLAGKPIQNLTSLALRNIIENIYQNLVEDAYRPLRGELDIHELTTEMLKSVDLDESSLPHVKADINYLTREYPRLLDRVALITEILQVSQSLELYGPGWASHPMFQPYAHGMIETQSGLLDVYRRSRINLANNTHGLGLHSRTFECMAVGGFIFTHASPHDDKPGGMLTAFEPDVHYGMFTPENIREEAQRWLNDDKKRQEAGLRAAEEIRERHCWHHRALQIIEDLDR